MSGLDFEPRNILVIDFGQLGDVILSLPALRAISENFPGSRKSVLVGSACAEIVRMSGLFDDVIEVDRGRLRRGGKLSSLKELILFAVAMRRRRFDLVIDLHSLSETNLLGYFCGAKRRLFANRESRSLDSLSNFRPKPPLEDKSIHLADNYLAVLRPLGIEEAARPFELVPSVEDLSFARTVLQMESGRLESLIGICPGAAHPSRRWPLEKYCGLALRLSAKENVKVVCFLGPEEESIRPKIEELLPPNVLVIHGINLRQLTAAFSLLSVLVGNDTGTIHVAAAAGIPVVLLMSNVAPARFFPLAERKEVIRSENIADIAEQDVVAAVERLLASSE